MKQTVLVIDVQPSFEPPDWLVDRCQRLADRYPSVATVFRHEEDQVPFERQLGWRLDSTDESLVRTNLVFPKNGYAPSEAALQALKSWAPDRVLVCGVQADACVLATGFALFDAGLNPTCIADAVAGSAADPSGRLSLALWRQHVGPVVDSYKTLV